MVAQRCLECRWKMKMRLEAQLVRIGKEQLSMTRWWLLLPSGRLKASLELPLPCWKTQDGMRPMTHSVRHPTSAIKKVARSSMTPVTVTLHSLSFARWMSTKMLLRIARVPSTTRLCVIKVVLSCRIPVEFMVPISVALTQQVQIPATNHTRPNSMAQIHSVCSAR